MYKLYEREVHESRPVYHKAQLEATPMVDTTDRAAGSRCSGTLDTSPSA